MEIPDVLCKIIENVKKKKNGRKIYQRYYIEGKAIDGLGGGNFYLCTK
jgi:hypothetical protein